MTTTSTLAQPPHHVCTPSSHHRGHAFEMADRPLASPSSDGFDVEHYEHLKQRQRESSVGNFDLQNESPIIVQINADRLRDKLSQIRDLPRKWMTQDELYYMAKTPDLWPWQRTDPLTPTPPDTPSSILETSNSKFARNSSEIQSQHKLGQAHPFKQIEQPSNPLRSRYNLRNGHSNEGRKGRIQKKQIRPRKHTMVTRSRCRGRCCQRQGNG